MTEAFIGEIRLFSGNFAPKGWAFCNGQQMSVNQNQALFSIIGTTYGGDGVNNFNLPNLQGTAPIGQGQGNGLTGRTMGQQVGHAAVTLNQTQIPMHTHTPVGVEATQALTTPAGNFWAQATPTGRPATSKPLYGPPGADGMAGALSPSGGNQPHNNMQPYLAVSYIICLSGIYPSQQ
ncbi:tail fiber protein [Saccharibacillus sp. CPCC 101409]|uniref:phage tail protein n=1 Tax=Saccharibacillus sp. CPCC 101409 TaxID=3058041 RepID=UPI0026719941|nr:tail fiber protein [Saccharibacillus sp. CPCC 101409]MDO3410551.1 tail fiber protein [Saccharibacillus sp. CPCC 101409]